MEPSFNSCENLFTKCVEWLNCGAHRCITKLYVIQSLFSDEINIQTIVICCRHARDRTKQPSLWYYSVIFHPVFCDVPTEFSVTWNLISFKPSCLNAWLDLKCCLVIVFLFWYKENFNYQKQVCRKREVGLPELNWRHQLRAIRKRRNAFEGCHAILLWWETLASFLNFHYFCYWLQLIFILAVT